MPGFAELRRVGDTPDNPIVMDRAGRIVFDCVAVPHAQPAQASAQPSAGPSAPRASDSQSGALPRPSGFSSRSAPPAPRVTDPLPVYRGIMGGPPSIIPRTTIPRTSSAGRRLAASLIVSPPRASGSGSGLGSTASAPRVPGAPPVYSEHLGLSPVPCAAIQIHVKGIMGGPPSIIPRTSSTSLVTRSTTQIRSARTTARISTGAHRSLRHRSPGSDENEAPAARGRTIPLYRGYSTRAFQGSRVRRPSGSELKEDDLYLTAARPPEATSPNGELTCGICLQIKSHPVMYTSCRHSHCYVCIRQWLEHSFQCPQCRTKMTSVPVPDDRVAAVIVRDHSSWKDESRVDYSWTGLTFPIPYPPASPIV
ncbi:hypothetical protein B0H16DRAFT_1452144 [Mycena metata]|uniref:RING-type domain-containing protein n=1 Tax=Mycena metata TaxID=1033252 RepID=A0AAD7JS19_9AGAR|nr:hypothetical protein B0H16DRAFT_1452144 [Mycena metata]